MPPNPPRPISFTVSNSSSPIPPAFSTSLLSCSLSSFSIVSSLLPLLASPAHFTSHLCLLHAAASLSYPPPSRIISPHVFPSLYPPPFHHPPSRQDQGEVSKIKIAQAAAAGSDAEF
ncbi:hypothetical protein C8R44DRAFT_888088 [Mycena epipterygia]|nr:hypothetical protein C8R44DRAFT_888088 [Mycena epipterygia]